MVSYRRSRRMASWKSTPHSRIREMCSGAIPATLKMEAAESLLICAAKGTNGCSYPRCSRPQLPCLLRCRRPHPLQRPTSRRPPWRSSPPGRRLPRRPSPLSPIILPHSCFLCRLHTFSAPDPPRGCRRSTTKAAAPCAAARAARAPRVAGGGKSTATKLRHRRRRRHAGAARAAPLQTAGPIAPTTRTPPRRARLCACALEEDDGRLDRRGDARAAGRERGGARACGALLAGRPHAAPDAGRSE